MIELPKATDYEVPYLRLKSFGNTIHRLADPEKGFQSFVELQNLVSEKEGKVVNYTTVYRYFRKGLGGNTKFIYSLHNFHLDNYLKINSLSRLNLRE